MEVAQMRGRYVVTAVVIALAAIGLITILVTDPFSLVKSILTMGAVAAIIYFVYRRLVGNSPGRNEQRSFVKAAKRTKKKHKKQHVSHSRLNSAKTTIQKPSRHRSQAQLTVIEGKKNKKKKKVN
jgi:hypothetical protein